MQQRPKDFLRAQPGRGFIEHRRSRIANPGGMMEGLLDGRKAVAACGTVRFIYDEHEVFLRCLEGFPLDERIELLYTGHDDVIVSAFQLAAQIRRILRVLHTAALLLCRCLFPGIRIIGTVFFIGLRR